MPKIFEYLGLIIYFFSNEHDPIHFHVKYQNYEAKIEFYIIEGVIVEIKYKKIPNKPMLPISKIREVKSLIEIYKYDMVQLWFKFFVLNEKIKSKKITTKIK